MKWVNLVPHERVERIIVHFSEKVSLLPLIQTCNHHGHVNAYNHLTELFGFENSYSQLLQIRSQTQHLDIDMTVPSDQPV